MTRQIHKSSDVKQNEHFLENYLETHSADTAYALFCQSKLYLTSSHHECTEDIVENTTSSNPFDLYSNFDKNEALSRLLLLTASFDSFLIVDFLLQHGADFLSVNKYNLRAILLTPNNTCESFKLLKTAEDSTDGIDNILYQRRDLNVMNSLSQEKGVWLSRKSLLVSKHGLVDYYSIALTKRPRDVVIISIRAKYGCAHVWPDFIKFNPQDFNRPQQISVFARDSAYTIVHYMTSQHKFFDMKNFELPLKYFDPENDYVPCQVSKEDGDFSSTLIPGLFSFGFDALGNLGRKSNEKKELKTGKELFHLFKVSGYKYDYRPLPVTTHNNNSESVQSIVNVVGNAKTSVFIGKDSQVYLSGEWLNMRYLSNHVKLSYSHIRSVEECFQKNAKYSVVPMLISPEILIDISSVSVGDDFALFLSESKYSRVFGLGANHKGQLAQSIGANFFSDPVEVFINYNQIISARNSLIQTNNENLEDNILFAKMMDNPDDENISIPNKESPESGDYKVIKLACGADFSIALIGTDSTSCTAVVWGVNHGFVPTLCLDQQNKTQLDELILTFQRKYTNSKHYAIPKEDLSDLGKASLFGRNRNSHISNIIWTPCYLNLGCTPYDVKICRFNVAFLSISGECLIQSNKSEEETYSVSRKDGGHDTYAGPVFKFYNIFYDYDLKKVPRFALTNPIRMISVGLNFIILLDYELGIWVMGDNALCQLGFPYHLVQSRLYPLKHEFFSDKNVVHISSGYYHSLLLTSDNNDGPLVVYAMGSNEYGQCGLMTSNKSREFIRLSQSIIGYPTAVKTLFPYIVATIQCFGLSSFVYVLPDKNANRVSLLAKERLVECKDAAKNLLVTEQLTALRQ